MSDFWNTVIPRQGNLVGIVSINEGDQELRKLFNCSKFSFSMTKNVDK